ncbi:hypothetical protein MKEN_01482500 [Mycena kentingensis (nom. inval.)]|nr:hypothetical protein MKEN_01482500 [Mycena kentingensis (nom. inval.)]
MQSSETPPSPSAHTSPTQSLTIRDQDLPVPTPPDPFPTKKSHAKKQPIGHIPRPRNAFILFRCDYSRQKQHASAALDWDQNDLSRVVGRVWKAMTEQQRAPWVHLAAEEKKRHAMLHPGFKPMPRNNKATPPTEESLQAQFLRIAVDIVDEEIRVVKQEQDTQMVKSMIELFYPPGKTARMIFPGRRAASCPPPGAVNVAPDSDLLERKPESEDDEPPVKPKRRAQPKKTTAKEKYPKEKSLPPPPVSAPVSWAVHPSDELARCVRRNAIAQPNGTLWASSDDPILAPIPMEKFSAPPVQSPVFCAPQPRRAYSQNFSFNIASPTSSCSTTSPPATPPDFPVDFPEPDVANYENDILPDATYPEIIAQIGNLMTRPTYPEYYGYMQ